MQLTKKRLTIGLFMKDIVDESYANNLWLGVLDEIPSLIFDDYQGMYDAYSIL
jgi:hypothetical protein